MITKITSLEKGFVNLPKNISPAETVFFDIETTGFAADVTALYLIGCIFRDGNEWKLIQWFADDKESERSVLEAFMKLIKNKRLLICYNGSGFDLPYLRKKFTEHCLNFNEASFKVLDLYREFIPFKSVFKLENLKQKTVESFMGINREDKFSGGELIKYYSEYLITKFTASEKNSELYNILMLHNREDMLGLVSLMKLYGFTDMLNSLTDSGHESETNFKIMYLQDSPTHIKICIATGCFVPEINFLKPPFRISTAREITPESLSLIVIEVPVYTGELKYFYPDYKNYYYLPDEDMAVHKNIASFMREGKKEKAKAFNCYTKHNGNFIPLPQTEIKPIFKTGYNDKLSYLRLSDDSPISNDILIRYVSEVMKYLLK